MKVISAADVIIEVLDARDPLGSRCRDVEKFIRQAGSDKKIILLLNKIGTSLPLNRLPSPHVLHILDFLYGHPYRWPLLYSLCMKVGTISNTLRMKTCMQLSNIKKQQQRFST